MRYQLKPVRMAIVKKKKSVREDKEKLESVHIFGGAIKWYSN